MHKHNETVTDSVLITAQIEAAAALAWCELVQAWEAAKRRASEVPDGWRVMLGGSEKVAS